MPAPSRPGPSLRARRASRTARRCGWARYVALPTTIWPGSADVCRRLVVLTTSPITVGSPPARMAPTSTSPVLMPMRTRAVIGLLGHFFQRGADRDRTAHRSFGVVLVRGRRAELGDDLVAHDLVEAATVRGHDVDQRLETSVDEVLHRLGVAGLRQRGEAHDVGHQHGHEAALVGSARQRVAAIGAEPRSCRHVLAARRAVHDAMPVHRRGMTPMLWTDGNAPRIRSRRVRGTVTSVRPLTPQPPDRSRSRRSTGSIGIR